MLLEFESSCNPEIDRVTQNQQPLDCEEAQTLITNPANKVVWIWMHSQANNGETENTLTDPHAATILC